jgi:predicted nucleotidyltransferase
MVINKVFDELFGTWSNVAVLRALLYTNKGYTGNETARNSGMHPRSALKALGLLEDLGVVNRIRGGRDHISTLNREHFLVKEVIYKLFESEKKLQDEIKKTLSSILKNKVTCAVIFGSAARGEKNIHSDLDLCCIVKSKVEMDSAREILYSRTAVLKNRYGIKLSPVFFTEVEFVRSRNKELIKEIISEGIIVTGKLPKGLV